MKSKLYQQRIDEAVDSVPIEHGGTAARTKETACKNLGLVSKDQIRQPDGIIVLGEDGLIRKSDLPPDILNNDLPSLFGPQDVELGATVPYYITNYSSDVVYEVSVGGGTFTRDVDCIYFTAQDAAAQGYIQVNARNFPLWIGPPKPMRPVILTPEEGIEQGPFAKFTSSDFIGRKSGDYHAGSEWRISTTVGFDTVVSTAEVSDPALLKVWTSTRLQRDTQYFAQVRYRGSLGGTSEWSLPHPFKTRASFIPEFYMATVGEEDYNYAANLRSVDIDSEGDRVILGDPTLDEDPNYDIGAIRIFRRTGRAFVEEAVMLDNPLSLNTEIKLQIPAGGVVQMTTDSVLVGNQTYTASTVFYAPSDASYVTLVGKGTDAVETQTPKPQQGLPEYPEGLPVYNAGQVAIAETGDRYYPEGLPVYVPAQLGGVPEYPDGLPPYDPYGTDVGSWEYPDGLPPYDPAFPRIPQQGSEDYPNGLPPYDDGRPYIAPTGNPAYPNGLPPYEPAGMVFTPGESASVSYNGQTYTFPGGKEGLATFTTVTLNFLSNQTEHHFGKEVSLSKDGKVAAASGNTFVWKGMAADLKIPPGGQIEFNVFSPNPTVETYFQDGRVAIPRDAYQVDLTGKGSPGSPGTVVPGATHFFSTTSSVSIPKGIRMITASGKGGPGSVILSPQKGLPEYPNGLPVYNAGQAYVADIGLAAYPSGLPAYNPGQAYVAPSGWVSGSPAVYAWNTPTEEITGYQAQAVIVPQYSADIYSSTSAYFAAKATTPPLGLPSLFQGAYWRPDVNQWNQFNGTYAQVTVKATGYQVSAATSGYYQYPGQDYIAPTGNPSYPSGLPAYVAGKPYIAPTGNPAYPNGLPPYEPPGTPQVGLPEYPNGLPVYNAGQPYIAPTGNPSYPSGLAPYDPGQAYVAPSGWVEGTAGTPATYKWELYASVVEDIIVPAGSAAPGPTASIFTYSPPTALGQTVTRYEKYSGTFTYNGVVCERWGKIVYDSEVKTAAVPGTSGYYQYSGQPYIAPSGNPSYPSGLPPYSPGQAYIAPTGNASYPNGLPVYSPAGTTKLKGPDSVFTINGQSYIYPGGDGEDPVIEKSYDITLPGTAIMDGTFTIAPGGSGKVSYEDGVIPNRTVAPLNTTVTRDGSIGISRAITTLTLRGKGQDGTRTTVAAQQGLPEYPAGLPVYNAGQPYIAPSGLPEYPNGLPPYSTGQAYVAPTGNPSYPNGLPPYSPGQTYIAPTGSSSYPNGLPPYNPGQPYIAPSAAVYGWNISESPSTLTVAPSYVYNQKQQVINSFGTPTGNGQTKSGGYSVQQPATLFSQYTVKAVAYQVTAYNAGQPYIAPRATTYKWQYGPATDAGFLYDNGEQYVPSEAQAKMDFLAANGSTPASASSSGSYVFSGGYTSGAESGFAAWYLRRITVTAVVDVQGTAGQPYIAPTAATYAWGTPDVTMTSTDMIITALPLVTGVSDAMSTAGTPTYSGQTFTRNVATSYSGTSHKNYAVSGTSYTVTAATSGQSYIAPTGSSSYPSGLPAYNPGQAYIAPTGNASYPSGLPAYNPGQAYVAPGGNPSYPSGLPAYTTGQPYVAPVGNVSYPSGLPSYKAAVISTTSGQNTTFTINGQTYTFQGGQEGASAVSRVETVTLPGTVDQTGLYTVPTGGSIEISHYGGTISGNAVPALDADIINTGYLTFESGLTVLEVTLKGGDGDIVIVEPEQGLLQFPNGLPRYVPGSSPQVGDPGYPDGLPIYRPATAETVKGEDSTFTINGQTYIFEGGNGYPAVERTEIIQLPGSSTLTATYSVAENVIGTVKHAAYEVWLSAGYPAIARINNTIYVFPGGETGEAASTMHNVPLVGSMNVGSVSTSLRTGESWSPPTVLTPEVDQEHLHFGTSISLDGTGMRMAVSAPGYDASKGAVWVYVREDGYWKREAFLSPKDLIGSDRFGYQVCMSQDGQVLAIGAPYQDQKGAVYLYQRIKDTWYFQAKVIAEDVKQWDNFGASVSLNSDGSILAVGAPAREYQKPVYEWDPVTETRKIVYFETCSYAGAVFTFRYAEGDWIQTSELQRAESPTYPINPRNGYFGTSVSLDGSGSALVVGIPGSEGGYGGMGAISTYIAQGNTWLFYKEVKPDTSSMSMQFSKKLRIAASGQYMIANANGWHNVNGESIHGASIVFTVEEWDTIAPPGDPITTP